MACEYCNPVKPKPIIDGGARVTVSGGVDAQMWVEWYGYEDSREDHETINYCPMCGRDLRGDIE